MNDCVRCGKTLWDSAHDPTAQGTHDFMDGWGAKIPWTNTHRAQHRERKVGAPATSDRTGAGA